LGEFYTSRHKRAQAKECYQKMAALWQRFPESNEYVALQRAAAAKLLASVAK